LLICPPTHLPHPCNTIAIYQWPDELPWCPSLESKALSVSDWLAEKMASTHLVIIFETGTQNIAAGHFCEFYPVSGCGLLSYFVVDKAYRAKGFGGFLVADSVHRMHADALAAGLPQCRAIFAETNRVDVSDGVMEVLLALSYSHPLILSYSLSYSFLTPNRSLLRRS
jgi:hypothetical protein